MSPQTNIRQIGISVLAFILWLVTIGLGLQGIASIGYIMSLMVVWMGGGTKLAGVLAWPLTCVMAIGLMAFILITGEFHRKRIGQIRSWQLFAWSIGIELGILLLHYFLR